MTAMPSPDAAPATSHGAGPRRHPTDAALLLDEIAPTADVNVAVTVMVSAPATVAYAGALAADFAAMPRTDPVVRWLYLIRATPDRITRRLRRDAAAPDRRRQRLLDLAEGGAEWVRLGTRPNQELVWGAIGRLTPAATLWRTLAPGEFAVFREPGWVKFACSVSVRPYGRHRALLTYETRVIGTDAAASRSFRRYWRVFSPGIRLAVWRCALGMKREAELLRVPPPGTP